jgi:tetratricopeptide (TPR) repeat protein
MAQRLLDAGSGPQTPPAAELLSLQASLASYAGRFEEAARLLNRAASFYRQSGDLHRFGRTLIKKGAVMGNAGELDSATRLLRRGIDLIDGTLEPRLMVCAVHNLIWYLHESGREAQAAACLDGARRLYQRAGDRRDLGRLRWLEGKIARRLEDAERPLREARDGLAREGLSYEAALASMDLAMRYAAEQRGHEMRRYADGMLPLFRSGDMYHETVQALLSFQKQEAELGIEGFLDEMGDYVRRTIAEKNPAGLLPAEPS